MLLLVRACGHVARAEDPAGVKDLVLRVHEERARRGGELSTRARLMLEAVYDMKNNAGEGGKGPGGKAKGGLAKGARVTRPVVPPDMLTWLGGGGGSGVRVGGFAGWGEDGTAGGGEQGGEGEGEYRGSDLALSWQLLHTRRGTNPASFLTQGWPRLRPCPRRASVCRRGMTWRGRIHGSCRCGQGRAALDEDSIADPWLAPRPRVCLPLHHVPCVCSTGPGPCAAHGLGSEAAGV